MKKQLAIAAALVCGGAYATSYVTGPGFTNLDFSSGTSGWGFYSDGGTFNISASGGVGKLTKTGDDGNWNTGIMYQCVPVAIGETVKLAAGKWSGITASNATDPGNSGYWSSVVFYTISSPDADPSGNGCVNYLDTPGTCSPTQFQATVDYPGNIEILDPNPSKTSANNASGVTLTSGHDVAGVAAGINDMASWTNMSVLDPSTSYNYLAVKAAMGGGWSDNQRVNYNSINTITSLGYVVIGLKYGTGPGYDSADFGNISMSGLQIVPEPASLGLLALGAMAFLGRRRK